MTSKFNFNKKYASITLSALTILFLCLISNGCSQKENEVKIQDLNSNAFCLNDFMKDDIKTVAVQKQAISESILLNAQVEPNPDNVVHFVSLVSGVVTKTYFSQGDEVKKGQLLLEIMSSELGNLSAEKSSVQSQITVAQRELESIKEMYHDKIASQKDLVQAQSNLDILKSVYENITSQLKLYSASSDRGVFQVRAPSSGIIIHKNVAAGTQISADSEPLFTISDLSEVWIMANIYAGNIPYVKTGMPVEIKAVPYASELFEGKINAIAQVFDVEERVLKARIVMDNRDGKLMPGMLVDVRVEKEEGELANAAPINALIFDNNQHFLVLYKSDCDIEVRKVTPHIQNAEVSEIIKSSQIKCGRCA